MNRIAMFVLLIALPLVTGCASSILPTSYLVHANVPYSDVQPEGGVTVFWTDRTVSMSPYKNIVVEQFAADKAVGVQPHIDRKRYSERLRHLVTYGLKEKSKNAATDTKAMAGKGPYLVLQGNIAQLNPGRPKLRRWIGFGAGRAIVDLEVKVFRVALGRRVLCGEITTSATASSAPLVASDDVTLLDACIKRVAENISQFIATHRNRKPKPPFRQ